MTKLTKYIDGDDTIPELINGVADYCNRLAKAAGWYTNIETGLPKERNHPEMFMLMVSEISEAMEAYRKDLMDDKLTDRKGVEVELADACIRIFDYAANYGLDLGGAIKDKLIYNQSRDDHKIENRKLANGKKF